MESQPLVQSLKDIHKIINNTMYYAMYDIVAIHSSFKPGEQCDAQEFYGYFMDRILEMSTSYEMVAIFVYMIIASSMTALRTKYTTLRLGYSVPPTTYRA